MHVWLRKSPRALFLVNSSSSQSGGTVLVVSASSTLADQADQHVASSSTSSSSGTARALVETVSVADVDWSTCSRLTSENASGEGPAGCLGLMNVGNDIFICLVTESRDVGSIRPGEAVKSIRSVAFYCINRPTWDGLDVPELHVSPGTSAPSSTLDPYDAILPQDRAGLAAQNAANAEHPCASLKRLLGMGSFYYAANGSFDLSTRLDRRLRSDRKRHDLSQYDGRFVWNTFMINPLLDFRNRLETPERERLDEEGFFLLAIQGYVAIYDMSPPTLQYSALSDSSSQTATSIAIVSRLSWKRAGTRFNTRGVDDDGNVANFVESETVFCHEGVSVSYVQLRGSVPLFWEQQGLQTFSARIQITRSRQASQPAFDRHFADLLSHYSRVHALNLLGTKDAETVLSNAYADHINNTSAIDQAVPPADEDEEGGLEEGDRIDITNFDFHAINRVAGGLDGVRSELKLLGPVRLKREAFSCTVVDSAGTVRRRQRGVFRTNCLDCLDRTNVVQAVLSETLLEEFLERAGRMRDSFQPFAGPAHPLWAHHRVLWAENGDALSKIYAGTGAINSGYTRTGNAKKTFGSLLSDAAKSAGRMYINNFQDKSKQNVIDALLGNMANQRTVEVYDPLQDTVAAELTARRDEYSTKTEISVFAGTWNLNAKSPGESLLPWLFPDGMGSEPDIYALGFQEIVPLSPQQILLTDPAKLRVWEGVILDTLAKRPGKKSEYVMLRSDQLVGTALIILVKAQYLSHVRQVEATTRKTGLKGMSGNKGGVGIRLIFHDTSFCFVTAHFAAGHSNWEERNADYWTIQRGLNFQRGRNLSGHDHVVWIGDFNYRIDLPNLDARDFAQRDDYGTLVAHDQLSRHHQSGSIFPGFREGPLVFRPTYKYDVGTDTYDSSEKQRVPAWTDRILYSDNGPDGHQLKQTSYFRAELKTSDHRPVYATFSAEVRMFDKEKRNVMRREILAAENLRLARQGNRLPSSASSGTPYGGRHSNASSRAASIDYVSEDDDHDRDATLPAPSNDDPDHRNWFDEVKHSAISDAMTTSTFAHSSDLSSAESNASSTESDSDSDDSGRDENPFKRTLVLRHQGQQYGISSMGSSRNASPRASMSPISASLPFSSSSAAPSAGPTAEGRFNKLSLGATDAASTTEPSRKVPRPPPALARTQSYQMPTKSGIDSAEPIEANPHAFSTGPTSSPWGFPPRPRPATAATSGTFAGAAAKKGPPPAVPPRSRPAMGSRSSSYTGGHSIEKKESLLDD